MCCLDSGSSKGPMNIDETLSRRLASVSFTCACLVVSIHVVCATEPGTMGWWLTHMFLPGGLTHAMVPMFFVISGFLLAGKMEQAGWWHRENLKRIRTLLIPYVLWNLIYWCFLLAFASVTALFGQKFGDQTWADVSLAEVYRVLGINIFMCPGLPLLWYVRCLIVYVVLSPILLPLKKRNGWPLIVGLWVLACYVPDMIPVDGEGWKVDFYRSNLFWGFVYFAVGVYLRWNPMVIHHRRGVGIGAALLAIAMQVYCLQAMTYSDLCYMISTPIIMLALWCLVPAISLRKSWGGASFAIYVLHPFVITVVIAVARVIGLKDALQHSVIAYFLQVPVIVCFIVGMVGLARHLCPRLTAFLLGGR